MKHVTKIITKTTIVTIEQDGENMDDVNRIVKVSTSWFAPPSSFLRCPYPERSHIGQVITKAHCRLEHGMERDDIRKSYGMPHIVEARGAIMSQHNGRKWNNQGTGYLI